MYGFSILLEDVKKMLYCVRGFCVFHKMKQATFYKTIYFVNSEILNINFTACALQDSLFNCVIR